MNLEQSQMILNGLTMDRALLLVLKLFYIVGGMLYFVFSLVVVRQIAVMKKTLITPLSPTVTMIGYVHLFATIASIIFFLLIL